MAGKTTSTSSSSKSRPLGDEVRLLKRRVAELKKEIQELRERESFYKAFLTMREVLEAQKKSKK